LLHGGVNVRQELVLLQETLVFGDVENHRGRMSSLGQDQRSAAAPHMFDQRSSIRAKLGYRSDVGVQFGTVGQVYLQKYV
jgi:hypothetical protein